MARKILFFVLGTAAIVFGAEFLVSSGKTIAAGVGIGITREDGGTDGVYLDVTDFDEHYTVYAYYKKQAYYGNVKHFVDFLRAQR